MSDKLYIFDTTLRDGEQSPGASMTRDEKIRISRYPNAYSIFGFCLGHSDFVTSLEVLDDSRIISGMD